MAGQDIRKRIEIYDQTINNKDLIQPFPRTMLLEVSNICNHACAFCANSKSDRNRGLIEKNLAKRILSEAYRLGTREVGFYATGEPLVDKNLEEYISHAKEIGFEYVFITTNGVLFEPKRAHSVIDAGIDSIKFSINGANKEDYLLIHGRDDFDKVIENLKFISGLRHTHQFKLYISFIMTKQTVGTKETFKSEYGKYVDDILFFNCINQSGYMPELNNLLAIDGNAGGYNIDGVCPMIFNKLHVTYEGYLTMCCADFQNYLAVADLNKEPLQDAWNNQYAQALRKRHLSHDLNGTICANCIYNCNETCEPLVKEYASLFDMKKYDKSAEIEERITEWNYGNR
ncbi:MAG: radical SAM protein [Roseburia sp.]|nr:radical SAM protein [Roseburia sp.]MCM1201652.1 radical SAM protein [Bacteroides fragilis]